MMKKIVAAVVITAGLAGTAMAAEFQAVGAVGMGGAGVARDMGAYAPYWNPAGLGFATKNASAAVGAGIGLRVSAGLADNVDRLAKFTEGDPSTLDNLKNLNTTAANPAAVADIVSLLSVIDDIQTKEGTLSLNAEAAVAFQVKKFGIGVYMLTEGYGRPLVDLQNVLPSNTNTGSGSAITPADLVTLAGTNVPTTTFFNAGQKGQLDTALRNAGFVNLTDRTNIINALGNSLASPTNPNLPQISPTEATNTFVKVVAPAFGGTAATNITNNQTAVMIKNALFTEIPISYGHAFSLKNFGQLAVGGSFKVVNGRVYQSRIRLTGDDNVDASDIIDGLEDNYEQSTNVTVDLGAQWKYADKVTVGLVAKNLTTPTFKSPELKDQNGRFVDPNGNILVGAHYREGDVKLKPQVRLGVAVTPLTWLSLAGDVDLTENETVLSGLNFKNRHLGGGVELSPLSWLKIRGGMYKNLANNEIGPVATAGLSFGIPWVLLEVDGAYGLRDAKYDGENYPRESKVQLQIVMLF